MTTASYIENDVVLGSLAVRGSSAQSACFASKLEDDCRYISDGTWIVDSQTMSKHNAAFLRGVEADRPFGSRKVSAARGNQMWDSLCKPRAAPAEFVGACDPPEHFRPGVRAAFFRRKRGKDLSPIAFDAARVAYLCRVTKPSHFGLSILPCSWRQASLDEVVLVGMRGKAPLFFLCPTQVDFECPDRPTGLRIVYA